MIFIKCIFDIYYIDVHVDLLLIFMLLFLNFSILINV